MNENHVLEALRTWKPMVVDASSQPHPELERLAQQCGCEFVGSKSFLVDEVAAKPQNESRNNGNTSENGLATA